MKINRHGKKIFHICVLALLLIALGDFWFRQQESGEKTGGGGESFRSLLAERLQGELLDVWLPAFAFAGGGEGAEGWFADILGQQMPLFVCGTKGKEGLQTESGATLERILLQEGADEYSENVDEAALEVPEESGGRIRLDDETARLLMEENQTGSQDREEETEEAEEPSGFVKPEGRRQEYDWSYYRDFDALIQEFYAVDATTEVGPDRLNLDALRGKDMRLEKNPDVPQILIYHTHSTEAFADSVPGDVSTTIMGAGELLAQILREEYGYNVIHHTGEYDVGKREYAYSNALPAIEQLLAENPTIEVVIDLHRDAVLEGRKLVMDLDGRPIARFMFFNGLSHTKAQGDIEYLQNPYIDDNLAFSFQMQVAANEYYPDLTRKIYLKGFRYNMHLRPRSLLIELGAQTNTVEEIRNACEPIAHVLDLVLSGEE